MKVLQFFSVRRRQNSFNVCLRKRDSCIANVVKFQFFLHLKLPITKALVTLQRRKKCLCSQYLFGTDNTLHKMKYEYLLFQNFIFTFSAFMCFQIAIHEPRIQLYIPLKNSTFKWYLIGSNYIFCLKKYLVLFRKKNLQIVSFFPFFSAAFNCYFRDTNRKHIQQ